MLTKKEIIILETFYEKNKDWDCSLTLYLDGEKQLEEKLCDLKFEDLLDGIEFALTYPWQRFSISLKTTLNSGMKKGKQIFLEKEILKRSKSHV